MGNYLQWYKSKDRLTPKKITYLCGPESVLIQDVIEQIKSALGECTYHSLDLEFDSMFTFNDLLFQQSFSAQPRLIVVRSAESSKDWSGFYEWVETRPPELTGTYIVFVSSSAAAYEKDGYEWKRDGSGRRILKQPARDLSTKGRVVECRWLNDEDLLYWVQDRAPDLGKVLSMYLIKRSGGDVAALKWSTIKLGLLAGRYLDKSAIDVLVPESPSEQFPASLILGDKKSALRLAEDIPVSDYARLLTSVDRHLDMISILNVELRRFTTVRDRAQISGVSARWAEKYQKVAFMYDRQKVARCRQALAFVYDRISGEGRLLSSQDGALQVLIALWT